MTYFSKDAVENGVVPVDELLSNSVYYPACGVDGRPIKKLNPLFAQYGINSYVYADYGIGRGCLEREQDTFRYYHVFATRDLKESDLVPNGWVAKKYLSLLSSEEVEEMTKSFYFEHINPSNAYGRWIVYERNDDANDTVGPKQFSLLYIGGEGAASYAALYLTRNLAPTVLVDINPGIAFGGNYACFRSVMSKIVNSGERLPKYFYREIDTHLQLTVK